MPLSNAGGNALVALIFNNVAWPGIGDAFGLLGSASAGMLYVALCSADPGPAGSGSAMSEVAYTAYTRVPVVRTPTGWAILGNAASNVSIVEFPKCTGGSVSATHLAILSAPTGGILVGSGALLSPLAISNNVIPEFPMGTLTAAIS